MAARKPLTVVGYMQMKDGRTLRIEDLTEQERSRCQKSMNERLARSLTEYYIKHPDEFERI